MKATYLFGGSFDPIHIGHAMLANHVSQLPGVEELWLMPGRVNPLKADRPPTADEHRLRMCSLVAERCANVRVTDVELRLPEPSYTWRTLEHLRENFPGRRFVLLIGSDNWLCFDRWARHEEILRSCGLAIYPRPGFDVDPAALPVNVRYLENPPIARISSTFVRRELAEGKNLRYLVPADVLEYIKIHRLYE